LYEAVLHLPNANAEVSPCLQNFYSLISRVPVLIHCNDCTISTDF